MALAIVVLFYWPILQFFGLVDEPEPQPRQTEQTDTTTAPTGRDTSSGQRETQAPTPVDTAMALVEPTDTALPDTFRIDSLVVETNKYTVTMTNRGGGPISILLKEYEYRNGDPIEMLPDAEDATPTVSFAGGSFNTTGLPFLTSESGTVNATRDTVEIEYIYSGPAGGQIVKKYRFKPDDYDFVYTMEVRNRQSFGFEREYDLIWNTSPAPTEPQARVDYDEINAVAYMAGSRETLDDYQDNNLNQTLVGNTSWAGVRSKYFAAALLMPDPVERQATAVFARGRKTPIETPDGTVDKREVVVGLELPFSSAQRDIVDSFTVFVGPLSYRLMTEYEPDLEAMLGIGTTPFVGWLIKPFAVGIIWLFPRMYNVIPNYGFVIILFALIIKLITMPLSMRSFRSMQAMKDLQPKIEQLKKKHEKDPQKMNKEMMTLYKEHGVNPISGCLPMLPQMPLFFAMFSVVRSTILLRNAPFVWPITDLSHGASGLFDPYIILVLAMVVAQFASQKVTMPSTQQNKALMYMMPLVFGFFFYSFPAGLVLYWTCFSLFSLIDYFAFKRRPMKNAEVQSA